MVNTNPSPRSKWAKGLPCPNNCGFVSHARFSGVRNRVVKRHLSVCPRRVNI